MEVIVMDFQNDLCFPTIPTNEDYYCRQLSLVFFNIHIWSSGHSTTARKSAEEVYTTFYHFICYKIRKAIKQPTIICDCTYGQSKLRTIFRFHYVIWFIIPNT
ncbi:hypothetical protein PR048_014527 [Dryococelus australis]|uniref:Uncharacterized protein n=1 Tax=Dryococelus australis TaxID=614101 RepID=A0ABQ9HEP3_9NEOP|nr:hypothetical protein PR048_014527 [Dryococelus australis]